MRFETACTVAADRRDVWEALHDPGRLRACIQGCRSVRRVSPERFEVVAEFTLGPLTMPLTGSVGIVASQAPCRLVLDGNGQSGRLAAATGRAWITLLDASTGCRLQAVVEATPRGWLMSLGAPLLTKRAEALFARFAANLAAQLAPAASDTMRRDPSGSDAAGGEEASHLGFAVRFDDERRRS